MFGSTGQREAELQQHWRVEHAERRAQLKERLRQCKEDFIQGMLLLPVQAFNETISLFLCRRSIIAGMKIGCITL